MGARTDLLTAAREAHDGQDWRASYDAFTAAQHLGPLEIADLDALGIAAWRLGIGKQAIQISEQVFAQLLQDDSPSAAMKANELALLWFNSGDVTIAKAWMNRARRLLAVQSEGAAHGYLLYLDALMAIFDHDYDGAARMAENLQDMGRRLDLPTLCSLGLVAGGLAAISDVRTTEAFAQLDEAMLPVLAEQVSIEWAGDIYCRIITNCYRVADLSRMRSWTAAMERWCEGPASPTYGGLCDIHRLQLLSATEEYGVVEDRLTATIADLEDVYAFAAAEGYYVLGETRRMLGDSQGARSAYAKARELGFEPQPGEALLCCQLGDHQRAWAELRVALESESDSLRRVPLLRGAVDIALARGRIDEADTYCRELETSATAFDTPGFRAWANQARGAVLVKQGRPAEALAALQAALREYRRQKCRYETAQVYEWTSLAHRAAGNDDMADADAATAESIYHQLGAEPNRICGTPPTPGGLTKRELEILGHIAGGASNREVAEATFISEKTVGRHLANIYAKLGVSSRTAAAAWAHEHNVLRTR